MVKTISSSKTRGAPIGNKNALKPNKREDLSTTVSQETLDYIKSMRNKMTPGQLIDAAIKLYKKGNHEEVIPESRNSGARTT